MNNNLGVCYLLTLDLLFFHDLMMARRVLELEELRRGLRRERIFRDRRNVLELYNDEELFQRYRF